MQLKSASHTNPVELFKSDGGSAWALLTAWEGYFAAEPESPAQECSSLVAAKGCRQQLTASSTASALPSLIVFYSIGNKDRR